jgi:hypothetical protein
VQNAANPLRPTKASPVPRASRRRAGRITLGLVRGFQDEVPLARDRDPYHVKSVGSPNLSEKLEFDSTVGTVVLTVLVWQTGSHGVINPSLQGGCYGA